MRSIKIFLLLEVVLSLKTLIKAIKVSYRPRLPLKKGQYLRVKEDSSNTYSTLNWQLNP